MSRTLVLPDGLYNQLEAEARRRGLNSIEALLAAWQAGGDEGEQRRRTVERIDALRARLQATYGEMPDSSELIREDRMR